MDLTVAIRTNQNTLLQFLDDYTPGASVAFGADPKLLVLVDVVKDQCIQAAIIATKTTTSSQELDRSGFQALPLPCHVILGFASRTTEAALPSDQSVSTVMPGTTFRNSRLLYH
jgi:hypothetical protein